MAPNPYFSDVQRGPWLTWERYLAAVYRHQRLNDGTPPPQPPTGLPQPQPRTAQGVIHMTPRRRRRRDGLPNRARTHSPVLVREDRLEVRSGTPPREATIVGPRVTPSRGIPQARPLTAAQAERIANTPAIPIAPLSVEGRQIVTEFGKIIKPYVQFIVKTKKPHGLYLKTKFGVQKLKDDKSGLYLKNNKNKKFYIYHWN